MDVQTILSAIFILCVVLVPTLWVQAWLNRSKDEPTGFVDSEEAALPALFRLARAPIAALCAVRLGNFFASLRPGKTRAYARQAVVANLKLSPEMIYCAQAFYCLAFAFLGVGWVMMLKTSDAWYLPVLFTGGFIGWVLPATNLESAADKRQTAIIKGLPFAIDLIASAMRAGLDFGAAIRYFVSLGVKGPLSVEFGIMLRQIELGKTRVEALKMMSDRISSKEFTSFASAVAHGTEIGASIVETMHIHGEEMRRARFHLAERKAARAPSLMILPMAVFILPAVFIIIFTPVYLKVQGSGMSSIMQSGQ